MDSVKNLEKFLDLADVLIGFKIIGYRAVNRDIFIRAYNEYLQSGINHLNEFSWIANMINNVNSLKDGMYQSMNMSDIKLINDLLNGTSYWELDLFIADETSIDILKEYKTYLEKKIKR